MVSARTLGNETYHDHESSDIFTTGVVSSIASDVSDGEKRSSMEGESLTRIPMWPDEDDDYGHYEESGGSQNELSYCGDYDASSTSSGHPTVEITVSLDNSEDYPSPSSVSLQHSAAEDLSSLVASAPALPPLPYQCPRDPGGVQVPPAEPFADPILLSFYKSRFRRRLEELNRSYDTSGGGSPQRGRRQQQQQQLPPPTGSQESSPSLHLGRSPPSHNSLRSNATALSSRSIRGSPRFVVILCAFTLVALSVHDRVETSSRQYQHNMSSVSRREEVAFPLTKHEHAQEKSSSLSTTATSTSTTTSMVSSASLRGQREMANLPKYYMPKLESAGGGNGGSLRTASTKVANHNNNEDSSSSNNNNNRASHQRANFAMARASQPRPIFVPDVPLPDGGFRKPVERFVFDPQLQQEALLEGQRYNSNNSRSNQGRRAISWTSWFASVALIGMLIETGWKEYQRCRLLEEEQRRL